MITIQQLEYIIAVDTYRHFVKAAQKCFVTQPTLSMQIKKLEEDLDIIIFDRSKQPVEPTDIGVKIIRQARKIIAETSRVNEIINTEKSKISGSLNIGVIPTIAPYLLPRFIGNFLNEYPDVSIKIQDLLSDEIITGLQNGTLDVGILVTPLNEHTIKETLLYYEPMVLYAHRNHHYGKQKSVDARSLTVKNLWLLGQGHCFRSQVLNICTKNIVSGNKMNFEYESGSLETIMKFVENEGGYTILPKLTLDQRPTNPNVKTIEFKHEQPNREVSLVYSRLYTKKRLIDLLSSFIQESVPTDMLKTEPLNVIPWR